jgi:transcriptional regulator with XRE-family HTH domain
MTPEQFTADLKSIHWSQAEFNRKVGTDKSTASSWATGKTPIPRWVCAYLGAMQDLAALHGKYLAPVKATKRGALFDDANDQDTATTGTADLDELVARVNTTSEP